MLRQLGSRMTIRLRRLGARLMVPKRRKRHWFDHPEMQARIAEAEADFASGRSTTLSSIAELRDYLDRLKR